MHLKLDELLRAVKGARNKLVDLEDMTDQEMDELQREFKRVHDQAKSKRMMRDATEQL
jgi:low affinity Fe/Cu permease